MISKSTFWRKFFCLFTVFLLVFQTVLPLSLNLRTIVHAEEEVTQESKISDSIKTPVSKTTVVDETQGPAPAPAATEIPTTLPTDTAAIVEQPQSKTEPTPDPEIQNSISATDSADRVLSDQSSKSAELVTSNNSTTPETTKISDWQSLDETTEQTSAPVVSNKDYRFKQTPVVVKFTSLPEAPGTLKISEIKLSPQQQSSLHTLSDTAYDITSSMSDGTFVYNLTLPLPIQAQNKNFVVQSSETADLSVLEKVEQPKNIGPTTVTIEGLNHFTVFVLVNDIDTDNPDNLGNANDVANGVLSPIEDSYVDQNGPTGTHGTSTDINVKSHLDKNQRGFIKFDLTSVPSASTVSKATLRLYLNNAPGSSRTYNLQRVTQSWTESSLTWNTQPAVSGSIAASSSVGSTSNTWVEWDVTNEVQAFLGGASNYGWRIADSVENNSSSLQGQLNSSNNGTELRRPQLVIDHTSSALTSLYNSPSVQAATSGGDGNGFETTPTGAFSDGGAVSQDINTNSSLPGDRHLFYNYGFTIPSGATIDGIEVRADWYLDDTGANNSLSLELSWDGGSSWTAAKTDITETDKEHVVSLGGASDTWGRSWSAAELDNTNFRVRVTANSDGSGSPGRDFYLDWIPVRVYYTADTTPPSTSFTDDVAAGPVLSDTISISVTDANPDTASYAYGFSSDAVCNAADTYGSSFASGSPFTLSTEANNGKYLCAKAADLAGNISYQRSANVLNIDRTAPTPTITSGPSGTVNSTSATFNFTADELVNFGCRINLEAFEICVFGSSTGSKTYTDLIDGAYTFTLQATDTVGNIDYFKNASRSWTVDATKPTTSDSGIDSNWHNTDVTVTLTCLDTGGAGCAATYYTTDGSTPTTGSSSGSSFTLSSNGTYTIKYFSTDLAGNSEAVKQAANQVKIDKTNPVDPSVSSTSHTISTPSNDTTIDVSWSGATDGLSGVAGYSYLFDTSVTTLPDTTSEGSGTSTTSLSLPNGSNYYFHLRTLDNAGNWTSTVHLGPFIIDTTAPSAPGTPSTTSPTNSNKPSWAWTPATDDVGINHYVFYWGTTAGSESNNSGNLSAATLSFTHSVALTDGTWYGKVKAFDAANNSTVSGNGNVTVDVIAPATPSATPGAGDYFSDQSVVLASSDSGTGLASVYYTLDGSTPSSTSGTLYASAINIGTDKTLKAIAYDNVGNSSSVLTAQYNIAPVISAETASSVGSSTVTITWTTDDLSTSRVIYDTISHPELGESPNYGYANSTVEADTGPKVTSHLVALTSLASATTYYYRVISHGSPEAVSSEKSFTTSSVTSNSDSSSSSNGGGIDNHPPAPTCGDSKPGSAPVLTSAVAGTNSVTLFWTSASDPVTYYLVTYGAGPGLQTYGNPNVGGKGTASYTISGLSGGTAYYFRVRAGNGCKPGDYSNELSATPFGVFISGPVSGFAPGVLGATENLSTGEATESGTALGTQSGEVKDLANPSAQEAFPWWWVVLILILGAGGYLIWRRYH